MRDPRRPEPAGRYVYGDFCDGRIRVGDAARRAPGRGPRARRCAVEQLSSFGEDARGRVYVVSLGGPVYRLAAPS